MTNPAQPQKELTIRGVILGVLITLMFTAANVFFGLKAGLTFATSIPAAVISMAVLRGFKGTTIQENNIVQTVASAAGTLSAIIFVLPGLVIIGWWTGFPYWTSVSICALGGMLGVMYSIPLRRALVTQSDLPYPEGVACAEVLKVGGGAEAQRTRSTKPAPDFARWLAARSSRPCSRWWWRTRIFAERPRALFPDRRARRRERLRPPLLLRAVRRRSPGRPLGRGRDAGVGALIAGSGVCRTIRR